MKRIITMVIILMVAFSLACPVSATVKKVSKVSKCKVVKVVKVKKVKKAKTLKAEKVAVAVRCPNCDGTDHNCPYWITDRTNGKNIQRHMTAKEIENFEWLEWHYQDEDGNWHEM